MAAGTFHIDAAHWLLEPPAAIRIAGWFAPDRACPWREFRALVRSDVLSSCPPTGRPDVQAHLGGAAHTLASGFDLRLPLLESAEVITIEAVDCDGHRVAFFTLTAGDLPGRSGIILDYSKWWHSRPHCPEPVVQAHPPLQFSLILPVFNPPANFLSQCLDSIIAQTWSDWELCVTDDGSSLAHVRTLLERYSRQDSRISVEFCPANEGISRSSNRALQRARGDYVVFVDHDDVVEATALSEIAGELLQNPPTDLIYTDEDTISDQGVPVRPFLKPDFSPEFLRGAMYPGHLLCVRRSLAERVRGLDPTYDGIQDYEFFLRLSEQTDRILHLPRILYHWRQSPSSSSLVENVKGDIDGLQVSAVRAHLKRLRQERNVRHLGQHRVHVSGPDFSNDSRVMLINCVGRSSRNPWRETSLPPGWSQQNVSGISELPAAIRAGHAAVFVVLNANILEECAPALIELAALARLPDSGMVAPVLISKAGRVIESGWNAGKGHLSPAMRDFDPKQDGYHGTLRCNREVAAVGPWCFAFRAEISDAVCNAPWGQNPLAASISASFRLAEKKLWNRVAAHSRIWVSQSAEVESSTHQHALEVLRSEWHERMRGYDPFFNSQFDIAHSDYRLGVPNAPAALVRWHMDSGWESLRGDGNICLRGWCCSEIAQIETIGLRVDDRHWPARTGIPRPDVQLLLPQARNVAACGFSVLIRLPPGKYQLALEASLTHGRVLTLSRFTHRVTHLAHLRFILSGAMPSDCKTGKVSETAIKSMLLPEPSRKCPDRRPT
jgi:O-antigen biosynthesis protein